MINDVHAYPHTQDYSVDGTKKWGLSRLWSFVTLLPFETISLLLVVFLLSRAAVFGELLPFGTAFFVAAAAYRKELTWFLALSASLGLLTAVNGYFLWQSVAVLLVCAVILQGVYLRQYVRGYFLPGVALVSTAIVKGAFAAISSAAMYTYMYIAFESLIAAGLTYVFIIVLQSITRIKMEGSSLTVEEGACYVVLAAGIISGINDVYLGELNLAGIVSSYLIIASAYLGGAGMGAGMGAVMGIIPSITAIVAPNAVGLYAFSGLFAGTFRHFGKLGALGGFILGHLIFSAYFMGETSLMAALAEVMIAGLCFAVLPEKWVDWLRAIMPVDKSAEMEQDSREVLKKVKELGYVFHELGRTFEQTGSGLEDNYLPQQEEDDIDNLELMLNTLTTNVCGDCPMFKTCWEKDVYNTYHNVLSLFMQIEEKGGISDKDIRGMVGRRCRRTVEMAATINCIWDICQVNCFWQKKLKESKGLVSSQLHGVADIISKLVKQTEVKDRSEEEVEAQLAEVLDLNGVSIKDVSIFKRNNSYHCHLIKRNCRGFQECSQKAAPIVEDILGVRMSLGYCECGMETGSRTCEISFVPRRLLDLDLGIAQRMKSGNAVSGDNFASVFLHSKTALILSDGMGCGSKAHRESTATVNLLKRLLESGFDRELAVKTVNATLALRSPEDSFATVDLATIDLFSGKADFVKIAAESSFVKKGGNIHVIASSSLPIGILDTVDYEPVTLDLLNGDLLVMATDGLIDAGRKCSVGEDWIIRELQKFNHEDPQRIADYLLARGTELSGGDIKDDMMVVVVRVVPYSLH